MAALENSKSIGERRRPQFRGPKSEVCKAMRARCARRAETSRCMASSTLTVKPSARVKVCE
jgi:hypothetical protein